MSEAFWTALITSIAPTLLAVAAAVTACRRAKEARQSAMHARHGARDTHRMLNEARRSGEFSPPPPPDNQLG